MLSGQFFTGIGNKFTSLTGLGTLVIVIGQLHIMTHNGLTSLSAPNSLTSIAGQLKV